MPRLLVDNDWGDDDREGAYGSAEMVMMLLARVRRLEMALMPKQYSVDLAGWTFDPAICVAPGLLGNPRLTSGTVYVQKIALTKATALEHIYFSTAVAAGATNGFYAGVYDKDGNRLAVTATAVSSATGGGNKRLSFTAPTEVITDEYVYTAILWVTGTLGTGPSLGQAAADPNQANISTLTSHRFATANTGVSALPSSINIAGLTASDQTLFVAIH